MRDKTTAEILETFDINRQTLASWVRKGCPHDKPKSKGKGKCCKYDESEVAAWLKTKGLSGKVGRPGGILSDQLAQARLRKETAMAGLHELRLAKEQGLLVDRSAQEQNNVTKFTIIRSNLMGLASGLAPLVAGAAVPEVERLIDERVREMLTELSRK